jgi:hypothetical protein
VFNGIAATKREGKSDARYAIRDKFNCRIVLWLKSTMAKLPENFENGLAKAISWKPKDLSILRIACGRLPLVYVQKSPVRTNIAR